MSGMSWYDIAQRPARGDGGRAYTSSNGQSGKRVRGLPYAEDRNRRCSRYVRACAYVPLYRARDDGSIQNSQSVYDLSRGEIHGVGRGSNQSLARVVGVEDSIDASQANSGRYAELLCNCGRSFIGSQAVGMFVSVGHYD